MKKNLMIATLIIFATVISYTSFSQKIYFYRDTFITGTVTDEQGVEHVWTNITLVKWDFKFGGIVDSYPYALNFSGKYGDSKVDIAMYKISKITFEKELQSNDIIYFYAIVFVNGNSRKLLLGKFGKNERRGPYFSFAGKSDFGNEVLKLWNIKELRVSSVNKAGHQRKE